MDAHKEFVLGALERVIALEKGESDEQSAHDVQHQLCHQVGRVSPIVREIAHEQSPHLIDPRSCKSGTNGGGHRRRIPSLTNDDIDFVVDEHRLEGGGPNLVPVCLASCCCPCANDVEDELGPVQHMKMSTAMVSEQTYGFSSAPQWRDPFPSKYWMRVAALGPTSPK